MHTFNKILASIVSTYIFVMYIVMIFKQKFETKSEKMNLITFLSLMLAQLFNMLSVFKIIKEPYGMTIAVFLLIIGMVCWGIGGCLFDKEMEEKFEKIKNPFKEEKKKAKSIFVLKKMLKKKNIPFEYYDRELNYQIVYPNWETKKYSIVQGFGTRGIDANSLELMDCETGEVEGYLTVMEVMAKINAEENKNNKSK